jgi:hypothetical protein
MKKSRRPRLAHPSTDSGQPEVGRRNWLFAVYFLFSMSFAALGGMFVCASMKLPGPINSFLGPLFFTAFGLGTTLAACRAICGRVPFALRHGYGIVTREDNPIRYWIGATVLVLAGLGLTAFGAYLLASGGF